MNGQIVSHRQQREALRSLPGPQDVLRRTLPNGITVLARENWSAPSVVVEGYIQVGNLDEPAELTGLASFTAGMLGRGTRRRTERCSAQHHPPLRRRHGPPQRGSTAGLVEPHLAGMLVPA